jgi:hypothetical protein
MTELEEMIESCRQKILAEQGPEALRRADYLVAQEGLSKSERKIDLTALGLTPSRDEPLTRGRKL